MFLNVFCLSGTGTENNQPRKETSKFKPIDANTDYNHLLCSSNFKGLVILRAFSEVFAYPFPFLF